MKIDGKDAWDWQVAAVDNLFKFGKGIVDAKPGSGKTGVGIMAIDKLFQDGNKHSILILVPTNALVKQWTNVINANIPALLPNIIIETFAYMGKTLKGKDPIEQYDLIIIDEAHHSHSPVFTNIYKIKSKYLLGLSATPSDECMEKFQHVLARVDWEEANVSEFTLHFKGVRLTDHESELYDKYTEKIKALYRSDTRNEKQLLWWSLKRRDLVHKTPQKLECATKLILKNADKRMMVFGERINQIEKVAKILDAQNVPYAIVHSDKEERFDEYMAGKVNILLSSRMLREGFNDPSAELGVIISFPLTRATHVQTIGRLVRYIAGKNANIFYIVAKDTTDEKLINEARRSCGWKRVTEDLDYFDRITMEELF